ncbi:MAG: hypothetical protein LBT31_01715 [Synergistaceae bacterium]|nr:hypothetical protein [Synergistaceae bacterium]
MNKSLSFFRKWRSAVFIAAMYALNVIAPLPGLASGAVFAATADELAAELGVARSRSGVKMSAEAWAIRTRRMVEGLTGEGMDALYGDCFGLGGDRGSSVVCTDDILSIGAPVYEHVLETARHGDYFNVNPVIITAELSKIIDYGGVELAFHPDSDARAKYALSQAAQALPAQWVRDIKSAIPQIIAKDTSRRASRGWFNGDTIRTKGAKLSIHELAHAWEYSVEPAVRLKREFYEQRTGGAELRHLGNIFEFIVSYPNNYRPEEKYRAGFVRRYMGKRGAAEVISCGLEYVFFNSGDIWFRDPEAVKFILGLLVFYGRQPVVSEALSHPVK